MGRGVCGFVCGTRTRHGSRCIGWVVGGFGCVCGTSARHGSRCRRRVGGGGMTVVHAHGLAREVGREGILACRTGCARR